MRRSIRSRLVRERRGVALVLTVLMTFAIGAIAMAAIYLSLNGRLIGGMGDRERELRYAADAALQVGKSLLNNDPAALPDSGYRTLVMGGALHAAGGAPIPNVSYNLHVGPTGSTTGQFGRFASVVSEAIGPRNARFIRRLELEQESFARYAYWTNQETSPSGGTIYFGGGDVLWGPVWSNDVISIHASGATFNDDVGTAQVVSGAASGTFKMGYREHEPVIKLPTVTSLSALPGYAAAGQLNLVAPTSGNETTVLMRLEFVATDLNADGDSTDIDEGFVRVYEAAMGKVPWLRGDWTTNKAAAENCGDYHRILVGGNLVWGFYPAVVHGTDAATAWARAQWVGGGLYTAAAALNHGNLTVQNIMSAALAPGQPAPRCHPGGHPHLVAIARNALGGNVAGQVGGQDSTFTPGGAALPTDQFGAWRPWPGPVDPRLAARRPWDAAWLFPLHRSLNATIKGVIHVNGTVAVSGVLRGRVTLYGSKTVVFIDDQRYATDPAGGICNDMLGVIAGDNIVVADNGIASPQSAGGWRALDDTKDFHIHGVLMSLKESFYVQNWGAGPTDANDCGPVNWGRGCLFLTGGLIQERRGAVGTTAGTGFLKKYSYDRCAVRIPPPYFPTTGRFLDNRYSEVDPGRFNVAALFASLAPTP